MKYLMSLCLLLILQVFTNLYSQDKIIDCVLAKEGTEVFLSDTKCKVCVKAIKYKKRSRLYSKIVNDFERSETGGFSCTIRMDIINKDTVSHKVEAESFVLVDADGCICERDLTRDDNVVDALIAGEVSCPRNIPVRVTLSFIVPSKEEQYFLKFNGWK